MKILHLNDHLAPVGGVETYLTGLLPLLRARGHEVHVAWSSGDGTLQPDSHQLPHMGSIRHGDIGAGRDEATALFKRLQPEVLHLHGIQNLGVVQAALDYGRVVMHGHDFRPICPAANFYYKNTRSECTRTAGWACYLQTLGRHCMTPRPLPAHYFLQRVAWIKQNKDRVARVMAPSEAAAQRFSHAGFPAERIIRNPYFCPLPVRDTPRPEPAEVCLTFLGRASYNKGWDTFVRALGKLPASVQGLMVGGFDESQRAMVADLARQSGCDKRLRIESWAGRDAIVGIMERTTLLVFPSLWPETLGIVGLEALSQGVPVIASDIGGVREWLLPGRTGLLAAPDDAEAIGAAAERLLASRQERTDMGNAGLALMRERFSPQTHLDTLLSCYADVASA